MGRLLSSVGGGWERKPTPEELTTLLYDAKAVPATLEVKKAFKGDEFGLRYAVIDEPLEEFTADKIMIPVAPDGVPSPAFEPGVRAGIHQQPVSLHLHEPGAGADGRVGVQVRDPHFIWL